jgi:hypothetical protein
MEQVLELAIETADGTADCRAEVNTENGSLNVTILYPYTANGFTRSEVYSHDMELENGNYCFIDGEELHPKIKKLETKLSEAIKTALAL